MDFALAHCTYGNIPLKELGVRLDDKEDELVICTLFNSFMVKEILK